MRYATLLPYNSYMSTYKTNSFAFRMQRRVMGWEVGLAYCKTLGVPDLQLNTG